MRTVGWGRTAKRELIGLCDWYGQLDPDLPATLTERVDEALAKLLDFPDIGSPVPDSNKRKWQPRRTPFVLFYRVQAGEIRVLKVRHVRSDWISGP